MPQVLVRPVHSETLIFSSPWKTLGILQLIVLSLSFSNYILYRCRLLFNRTIFRTPVQIFRGCVLMYMCVCMCAYVALSFTSTLVKILITSDSQNSIFHLSSNWNYCSLYHILESALRQKCWAIHLVCGFFLCTNNPALPVSMVKNKIK